jgi:hypothetical protein
MEKIMRNDYDLEHELADAKLEKDLAEQQGPRAGGRVRPGFIVGFVLACVLTAGITWAAKRGESSLLATPVNAYGNAGVPLAQHSDAGELECYVTNQPGTSPSSPGYQVCEYQVADGGAAPVTPTSGLPVTGPTSGPGSAVGSPSYQVAMGSDGVNNQVVRVNGYGGVATYSAENAPSTIYSVSLSANVSSSQCSLTAGALYLLTCDADAAFRATAGPDAGAAMPAVATDTRRYARTEKNVRLLAGQSCIALISASAATCTISLIPVGP